MQVPLTNATFSSAALLLAVLRTLWNVYLCSHILGHSYLNSFRQQDP